jgi:flavin-dependent dehydrogenase
MTPRLIIGAGPAGASLAIRLARQGREVVLLEREALPADKVCGEFLSFEAAGYLKELGLDLKALGAVPVDAVDLSCGSTSVGARLPFNALSLSRKVMDEALLQTAIDAGAKVRRGARVTELKRTSQGWRAWVADGSEITAGEVFLATGKHDVRGWRRPPGPQGDLIGFKQHFRLAPSERRALDGRVELHLFNGGYAGLQPVDGGRANLCLVVRRSVFERCGQAWPALFTTLLKESSALRRRLGGAEALTERPLAVGSIPYGLVVRASEGLWRLGDQAAVIPSFAGEGMSIALHSARLAAEVHAAGGGAHAFQRRLAEDVGAQVGRATLASRLLVRPWSQAVIGALLGGFPSGLGVAAAATRIPVKALARAA